MIRRTVLLEREGRSIRAILLVPALARVPSDPLRESLGAYSDEPLWDDWLAEIATSRNVENSQEAIE
jgi:hypothetical protein